jgi:hypothetical protein
MRRRIWPPPEGGRQAGFSSGASRPSGVRALHANVIEENSSAHLPRFLVIDDEPQIHRFLGPALEATPGRGPEGDRVVLLPPEVGLHIGRRHQPHVVTQRRELPGPVMRRLSGRFSRPMLWGVQRGRTCLAAFGRRTLSGASTCLFSSLARAHIHSTGREFSSLRRTSQCVTVGKPGSKGTETKS